MAHGPRCSIARHIHPAPSFLAQKSTSKALSAIRDRPIRRPTSKVYPVPRSGYCPHLPFSAIPCPSLPAVFGCVRGAEPVRGRIRAGANVGPSAALPPAFFFLLSSRLVCRSQRSSPDLNFPLFFLSIEPPILSGDYLCCLRKYTCRSGTAAATILIPMQDRQG